MPTDWRIDLGIAGCSPSGLGTGSGTVVAAASSAAG